MTNTKIITNFLNGATTNTEPMLLKRYPRTPLFIEGDTLYSYGKHYELAKRLPDGKVWVNTERYSATTSKHTSLVRSLAIRKGIALA